MTVIASSPEAREVDRQGAQRPAPRRSGSGCRATRGDGSQVGDRLDRADLVVGPHDADERDVDRVAAMAASQGLRVRPARVRRPAATRPRRPRARPARGPGRARRGARRRSPGSGRGAGPRRGGPVEALDREVVRLGAAAGEDHLAGPRAERLGQRLAGLLDDAARPAAGRVQRRRVADHAEALRHRLDRLGDHRRGGRVVEVGRSCRAGRPSFRLLTRGRVYVRPRPPPSTGELRLLGVRKCCRDAPVEGAGGGSVSPCGP